jgi:Zn-dependent M28 family amino/carboxypeptidase
MIKKNKSKINKKIILIFILLFVVVGIYYKFTTYNQKFGLVGSATIKVDEINFYLDNLNKERFTEESKKTIKKFLIKEFNKYGYKVTEQNTGKYTNLIAEKENVQGPYILVGAHYDTVPNTVGMDDNASGVAALLSVAKYNKNPNVKFVAFDGEEDNLSGSRFYAKNTTKPKLVVIFETVGYYTNDDNSQNLPDLYNIAYPKIYNQIKSNQSKGNFSAAICSNNAKVFCQKYESYGSYLNLNIYTVYIPSFSFIKSLFLDLFRSDHTPFFIEGIPVVMITDTANFRTPNYHKTSDARNTVNVDFIANQANAILSAISDD